mgnify:FL=1
MKLKTFNDIGEIKGKKVLLRADLNVPMKNGKVQDSTRIEKLKPTVNFLKEKGAKIIVCSHLGRPKGKPDMSLTLQHVTESLEELWKTPVTFINQTVGPHVVKKIDGMSEGDVLLLENVRFHDGEETNSPEFAKSLAELADIFVNDAFSVCHRAHASTEAVARILPSYAGYFLVEEIKALEKALENPEKPTVAIIGGAKVSSKLSILHNLTEKMETLIIGGAMANTFLKAEGYGVGKSLVEDDMLDMARQILEKARSTGCEILLPDDCVIADKLEEGIKTEHVDKEKIPDDKMVLDIGTGTVSRICEKIDDARTLVWNGPLGVFEVKPFDRGTLEIAHYAGEKTGEGDLLSVVGGGDTISALKATETINDFSYVSAAGGAFLEWLEGKKLPGVSVLEN